MASTTESAPEAFITLPRRVDSDPAWLQDQAEARACGLTVGQLRDFKRRHRLALDQRLGPDARELLALELETAERVAMGEQLERAKALALIAELATPEAAAAVAAVLPSRYQLLRAGHLVWRSSVETYLLNRVEALTGKLYAAPGNACRRAAALAAVAADAVAHLDLDRDQRCLFWGVILRLDQLEGAPPPNAAAFFTWCQLDAYSKHVNPKVNNLRGAHDLLAGRVGSVDARGLLQLPESGPLDPVVIRAAYRAKARQLHPDAGGDRNRFERLTEARDRLLLDQQKQTART